MAEKLNLARIKKFGKNFEVSIDSDKAMKYKKGEVTDLREVLLADNIFTDARKGLVAAEKDLQEAFKTTDKNEVAEIILKQGEVQQTAEHRAEEREKQKRKLIHIIHQQAIDPTTNLPHPETRIEAALEEAKVQFDYNKEVEQQLPDIIAKLRPIIPISIEKRKLNVTIPAQFAGKAYSVVSSNSKILQDSWLNTGDWKATVELPAGLVPEFISKLNELTHGQVIVEEK